MLMRGRAPDVTELWNSPPGTTHTSRGRRVVARVSVLVLVVGAVMMAFPLLTDVWAQMTQDRLAGVGLGAEGGPVLRLQIPRLDVDVMVADGTSQRDLRAGVGHYPSSASPGERGNVAIAGHRTTFGAPFADLEQLEKGDRVILTTASDRYVYEITRTNWVVSPLDWSPIRDFNRTGSFVTLTSCHPEGSASSRIAVRARLTSAGSNR